jgi:FkbM family methyltransferase
LATRLNFKVLAGDPTPIAKKFMQEKSNIQNLDYVPEAIWIENGVKKFFISNDYNSNKEYVGDGSLTNYRKTNTFINITCHDLKYYMKQLDINEIDVLKMDIEGAAIEIIDYCINNSIFPKQITGEIEIPSTDFSDTINKLENLLSKLKPKYIFFLINQKNRFQKFEFLMVRNS